MTEGQGGTPSSASEAGRRGNVGPGAAVAAGPGHPDRKDVTGDLADIGEARGHNGEDSDVTITPGYSEESASAADPETRLGPMPPSSQRPRQFPVPRGEFSAQQTESDNPDTMGYPDRNDKVPARDGDTGQDQSAADVEAQSGPQF